MRVAVVDIGTNSTRLLVADVHADGSITELDRRTRVTRLGEGVDASGVLSEAAIARVLATLDDYAAVIAELGAQARPAVLTSAVRDAANGQEFVAMVEQRYGLEARAIAGSEEAQLSFLGATSDRDPHDQTATLVIDVGGGSTELTHGLSDRSSGSVPRPESGLAPPRPGAARLRAGCRSRTPRSRPARTPRARESG